MIISIFLYPLIIMSIANIIILKLTAIFLLLLGALNILSWIIIFLKIEDKNFINRPYKSIYELVIYFIFFSLFLIALGPLTNADSLDYHIGFAIEILNNNSMPFHPEWFTGRHASNGEILNALGLAIGSEQFGALIQLGSLLSITALIWPKRDLNQPNINSSHWIVVLAAITCPVIIFLVSSAKPQLWPVAMTSFAFYIFLSSSSKTITSKELNNKFILVCMLCMCASQTKFNYLLGGSLAGFLMLCLMVKNKKILSTLVIFFITFFIIVIPPMLWKLDTLDTSIFEVLTNPLPGQIPGTENAVNRWRLEPDVDSFLPFPLSIFIPTSISAITASLGIGVILIFYIRQGINFFTNIAIITIILFIVLNIILAPPAARTYLEPYFWGLILCSHFIKLHNLKFPRYIKFLINAQACFFIILSFTSMIILFPGAVTQELRERTMTQKANGYNLMSWADSILPEDAILINNHRSMALVPRQAFNNFYWVHYVDLTSKDALYFLNRIKKLSPTHILVTDEFINQKLDKRILKNCYGKLIAGPVRMSKASRNPFNEVNSHEYNAWIYEFNHELLPKCDYNK
jgi:hypothetical protein